MIQKTMLMSILLSSTLAPSIQAMNKEDLIVYGCVTTLVATAVGAAGYDWYRHNKPNKTPEEIKQLAFEADELATRNVRSGASVLRKKKAPTNEEYTATHELIYDGNGDPVSYRTAFKFACDGSIEVKEYPI